MPVFNGLFSRGPSPAAPPNPVKAPNEKSEASSPAETDPSTTTPTKTSQTSSSAGTTTPSQLHPTHEGQQAKDRASENPPSPPTPTKLSLKDINDVQLLIDKQKDALPILKGLQAERKKAASQLSKAQSSLPKASDLEDRIRLLKEYLQKLERGDTDSGNELGALKAKIQSELTEVAGAVTAFEEHYNNVGGVLRELRDKLA